jgi:type II secretory pathway predicted ATPase ExeA
MAYHLRPFTREESAASRQHPWQHAGMTHPVFTDAALTAGHDWVQGIPRRLNRWPQACLLAAYSAQPPLLDDYMVAIAMAELEWAQAPV